MTKEIQRKDVKISDLKKETIIFYFLCAYVQGFEINPERHFSSSCGSGGFSWHDHRNGWLLADIISDTICDFDNKVKDSQSLNKLNFLVNDLNEKVIKREEDILNSLHYIDTIRKKTIIDEAGIYCKKTKSKLLFERNKETKVLDKITVKKINAKIHKDKIYTRIVELPEDIFKRTISINSLFLKKDYLWLKGYGIEDVSEFYFKMLEEDGYFLVYRDKETNKYVYSYDFTQVENTRCDVDETYLAKLSECQETDTTQEN